MPSLSALIYLLGWAITAIGLLAEAFGMVAMAFYRVRSRVAWSPGSIISLGGALFFIGLIMIGVGAAPK